MNAWPQYLMIAWLLMQFAVHLVKDKAEASTFDRASSVFASLFVVAAFTFVLWAGDFWAPLGWKAG